MYLTIASWNMAGASLLKTSIKKRAEKHQTYNKQLKNLIAKTEPDIILLQEIIRYGDKNGQSQELFDIPSGYYYTASMAIDTVNNSYPPKWNKIRREGGWPKNTYLGHGLGILWKKNLAHSSLWNTEPSNQCTGPKLETEAVRFETGLFTGNRDTEPRMAMVAHFHLAEHDFFIINVHLTTLKGEREGFPEKDQLGSSIRQKQVDILLNGIISRLNSDRQERFARIGLKAKPGIWLLGGDLNATMDAPEITKIQQLNFARLCSDAPTKRGKKGNKPTIKVDYFFAGPKYYAFNPVILQDSLNNNENSFLICDGLKVSDHFPIVARFPIPN